MVRNDSASGIDQKGREKLKASQTRCRGIETEAGHLCCSKQREPFILLCSKIVSLDHSI